MSVTRRTALGAGLVAGAALVTACGSSSTAATSTTPPPAASSNATTASSSASKTATSTSSAPATSASSASASAGGTAGGTEIAKVADIPAGDSLVVANGTQQIALTKKADGTVIAHTAICTHQGCTVKAGGATLNCPCHGSVYEALTGAVTKGPAKAPLAEIAVEVKNEAVFLKV